MRPFFYNENIQVLLFLPRTHQDNQCLHHLVNQKYSQFSYYLDFFWLVDVEGILDMTDKLGYS